MTTTVQAIEALTKVLLDNHDELRGELLSIGTTLGALACTMDEICDVLHGISNSLDTKE